MANFSNGLLHIVGTDIADGDTERFDRWYADHIHLLMKFPGIRAATRFRLAVPHETMPENICLYEFGSMEDFQRYNESAEFKAAEVDRWQGWAQDNVLNRLRVQYTRLGHYSK